MSFDFVARVDQPNTLLATGTVFNGSFSYDDALTPSVTYITDPSTGGLFRASQSRYDSPSITLSVDFGGQHYSVAASAGVFDVMDGGFDEVDSLYIYSIDSQPYVFDFGIWNADHTAYADTSLPGYFPNNLQQVPFPEPIDDDDEDDRLGIAYGEFRFYDGERQLGFEALVLSITPANAIPEPQTWAMMVGGFGLLGGAARRRNRVRTMLA